jgi:hypothetical protein
MRRKLNAGIGCEFPADGARRRRDRMKPAATSSVGALGWLRSPSKKLLAPSGKSPAYLHHRRNGARAGKPAAGFFDRTEIGIRGAYVRTARRLSSGEHRPTRWRRYPRSLIMQAGPPCAKYPEIIGEK